jgi:hypothetical protein
MELPLKLLFNLGDIVFIKKYEYDDGGEPTDKLLIVLNKGTSEDLTYISFTLTTSQLEKSGITGIYRNEGCTVLTESPKLHFYYFKKGKVIGNDGFSFDLDTVVIFQNNVRFKPIAAFEKYLSAGVLTNKGTLSNIFLKELIECALNSEHIPGKLETKLRDSLNSIAKA